MSNPQPTEVGEKAITSTPIDSAFESQSGVVTPAPAFLAAAEDLTLSSGKRILVVEDEKLVLRSMSEVLQCHGYKAFSASNGAEALELCQQFSALDLLLVDFMMPGINGSELAHAMKALFPRICVLLMTGYGEQWSPSGLLCKTAACLRKPFSSETLLQRVRQVLQESSANQAPAL